MKRGTITNRFGFTLIEMMVTIAMSTIVVFGIGIVLVDNQRGWQGTYNRVYSDVVTDCYVARKVFDSVVRKSSVQLYTLDDSIPSIEVYYYSDPNSSTPNLPLDRYARFYKSGDLLRVDYGTLDEATWTTTSSSTVTLARNVRSVNFSAAGTGVSLQMILTLDNNSEAMTVMCSAVRHND